MTKAETTITRWLKEVFFFEGLSEKELSGLAKHCSLKDFRSGDFLFHEEDAADACFLMVSGLAKVFKLSPKGEEQTLHLQESGDLVAEAAIFGSTKYPASAKMLAAGKVLRIPRNALIEMIQESPPLALKLMHAYSKRLRSFVTTIEHLTLASTRERLAHYLLQQSTPQGDRRVCHLRTTKKELASVLGTVPETLSRALGYFRESGWLEGSGKELVLTNPQALTELLNEKIADS